MSAPKIDVEYYELLVEFNNKVIAIMAGLIVVLIVCFGILCALYLMDLHTTKNPEATTSGHTQISKNS